jgi:hypothetical protein
MSAIGGDDDRCRNGNPATADGDAGHATTAPLVVEQRTADRRAFFDLAAGGDGLLQQDPVEIAAEDRAAADAVRVTALDRGTALAREHHPFHAQAARLDLVGNTERAQPRQRAGVDGVASQLVARKCCAIEDADTRAGARQDEAGACARRSGANDDDVRPAQ